MNRLCYLTVLIFLLARVDVSYAMGVLDLVWIENDSNQTVRLDFVKRYEQDDAYNQLGCQLLVQNGKPGITLAPGATYSVKEAMGRDFHEGCDVAMEYPGGGEGMTLSAFFSDALQEAGHGLSGAMFALNGDLQTARIVDPAMPKEREGYVLHVCSTINAVESCSGDMGIGVFTQRFYMDINIVNDRQGGFGFYAVPSAH